MEQDLNLIGFNSLEAFSLELDLFSYCSYALLGRDLHQSPECVHIWGVSGVNLQGASCLGLSMWVKISSFASAKGIFVVLLVPCCCD